MSELPSNIADHESAWIELLVDDELTTQQTQQLFDYLDRVPTAWKRCATALLDERLLKS